MTRLLYATFNPGKLEAMRRYLAPLGMAVYGLGDLQTPPEEAPESGRTALENAREKATTYHKILGVPLFSCDTGLRFLDGVEALSPGVHVRTGEGRRMDDREMTDYYAGLARAQGGKIVAQYQNAICLIDGQGRVHESDGDELAWPPFWLCDRPHPVRHPGFPLDPLSLDPASGKYFEDLAPGHALDVDEKVGAAFRAFFMQALGQA